jgi:hypothetical protein
MRRVHPRVMSINAGRDSRNANNSTPFYANNSTSRNDKISGCADRLLHQLELLDACLRLDGLVE